VAAGIQIGKKTGSSGLCPRMTKVRLGRRMRREDDRRSSSSCCCCCHSRGGGNPESCNKSGSPRYAHDDRGRTGSLGLCPRMPKVRLDPRVREGDTESPLKFKFFVFGYCFVATRKSKSWRGAVEWVCFEITFFLIISRMGSPFKWLALIISTEKPSLSK
jgi:hypothetical protein